MPHGCPLAKKYNVIFKTGFRQVVRSTSLRLTGTTTLARKFQGRMVRINAIVLSSDHGPKTTRLTLWKARWIQHVTNTLLAIHLLAGILELRWLDQLLQYCNLSCPPRGMAHNSCPISTPIEPPANLAGNAGHTLLYLLCSPRLMHFGPDKHDLWGSWIDIPNSEELVLWGVSIQADVSWLFCHCQLSHQHLLEMSM